MFCIKKLNRDILQGINKNKPIILTMTAQPLKFISINPENNCVNCDHNIFEKLSQLVLKSTLTFIHKEFSPMKYGCRIINDCYSGYKLKVYINSKLVYKINGPRSGRSDFWSYGSFMEGNFDTIAEVFGIDKSIINDVNSLLNEIYDSVLKDVQQTTTNSTNSTNSTTSNYKPSENATEQKPQQYYLN